VQIGAYAVCRALIELFAIRHNNYLPTSIPVLVLPPLLFFLTMSRRPQQQAPVDTNQPEVPEDELLSGVGEGDEVMEEVEEQEGYSAYLTPSH